MNKDKLLKLAERTLEQIAGFGDPWEISQKPEDFGGTDDGLDTVCMAYENMQVIAQRTLTTLRARSGP